jgi:predicted amidohydrolase YtcJ
MGAPHINPAEDLETAHALRDEARSAGGALPEVVGYWGDVEADLPRMHAAGLAGAAGDICVDGAIGSRTAALAAPYSDDPSTSGHLYLTAEQVADHVVACTEAGLQAGFHMIGDRAVTEAVAGLEAAAERVGIEALRLAGHRLEHLEMVSAEQVRRLGRLGLTASMQPLFEGWWGGPDGLYETRLGERARGMNPFASLAAAGVPLAFGSDSPVTPFDPWGSVRAAVRHRTPGSGLDPATAVDAHTRGGWWAARRDADGVVATAAPATFAVWDVDELDPATGLPWLGEADQVPRCRRTVVRGTTVFDRDASG